MQKMIFNTQNHANAQNVVNPMYLDEFITHIEKVRRYSPRTVKSYHDNIIYLSNFLKNNGLCTECAQPKDIGQYVEYCMERGLKPNSINQHLSSFRSYYDYCCRFHGCSLNPAAYISDVRTPKILPRFIPENKMNYLIDKLLPVYDFKTSRTRIIVLLFYHTGMRCKELTQLKMRDVRLEENTIRVVGKGNKERLIPFGEELNAEIIEYLSYRADLCPFDDNLILTSFGRGCEDWQIRRITKMALKRIVPEELAHPHILRHTFATVLMNHGAKIENVKLLLGHKSVDTTQIYEHVSITYLKNIYNKNFARK